MVFVAGYELNCESLHLLESYAESPCVVRLGFFQSDRIAIAVKNGLQAFPTPDKLRGLNSERKDLPAIEPFGLVVCLGTVLY